MSGTIQLINISPDEFLAEVDKILALRNKVILERLQPPEPLEFYTTEELCKKLKVDRGTLYNWRKKNLFSTYGMGNRVYFKRSEVEAAMVKLNHN